MRKIVFILTAFFIFSGYPSPHSAVPKNHVSGDHLDVISPTWFDGRVEGIGIYAAGQSFYNGVLKDFLVEDLETPDSRHLAGLGSPVSVRKEEENRSYSLLADDQKTEQEIAVYYPNRTAFIYPKETDPTGWNWGDVAVFPKNVQFSQESVSIFLFGTGIVGLTGVLRRRLRTKKE